MNYKPVTLAPDFFYLIHKTKSVHKSDILNISFKKEFLDEKDYVILSNDGKDTIRGILIKNDNVDDKYDLVIYYLGDILAPKDCSSLFANFINVESMDLSNFNIINTLKTSLMFNNCYKLTSLDLYTWKNSNVKDMSFMFYNCYDLKSIDLSNFNLKNAKLTKFMFYNCYNLASLKLSNENLYDDKFKNSINLVKSNMLMSYMFYRCHKLNVTINILFESASTWTNMFYDCAIDSNSKIVINYLCGNESLIDEMISTKTYDSNVIKGSIL